MLPRGEPFLNSQLLAHLLKRSWSGDWDGRFEHLLSSRRAWWKLGVGEVPSAGLSRFPEWIAWLAALGRWLFKQKKNLKSEMHFLLEMTGWRGEVKMQSWVTFLKAEYFRQTWHFCLATCSLLQPGQWLGSLIGCNLIVASSSLTNAKPLLQKRLRR